MLECFNSKVQFYCHYGHSQRIYETDIQYNFQVKGSIAQHQLQLKYLNNTQTIQNFTFSFDLSEDFCFDNLSIKIDEKIINCLVKEKEEAKEEYKNALRQGKTAALGSFQGQRGNFQVQVGNIENDQEFLICFNCIEQLTFQGEYYKMTLPFRSSENQILFENLKIIGDIYAQTEQDCIVLNEFNIYQFNKLVKFTQVTAYHTEILAQFSKDTLKSIFQNGLNLEFLKIKYDKQNVTLLSSYQNDSEISPYCVLLNFVPNIAQVKKQLFRQAQNEIELMKAEFLLLIDRSGSMVGSNIETAKQALIFFLKSLPEGSIYNIISFGTNYTVMYPQSVQVNDQNLQDSIDKIEKFQANMGGTNISQALKYLMYNLQDQYGLRKKIYIITDGEFQDYQPALEIVKKNKFKCDINALCIGSYEFLYATQILNETGGNFQKVTDTSQIISQVIQLLKDSFENFNGVQMSLISDHDDSINCIVPDPQQICYIDTSKTLRFYIFLNRKLEEVQQIKFKLITTYQGSQKTEDEYIVDIKDQISNEFAHIHKMGLYQLIRQVIINQQRKCENVFDDISNAMKPSQDKMIELLKNEAIRYQILCEYTAFIGSEYQLQEEVIEGKRDDIEYLIYQSNLNISKASKCLSIARNTHQKASCCGGGSYSYQNKSSNYISQTPSNILLQNKTNEDTTRYNNGQIDNYSKVIQLQKASGLWQYSENLIGLLDLSADQVNQLNPIKDTIQQNQDIWMTIVVTYWLQKFHQKLSNQHQYILLKAYKQIDRFKKQNDIEEPVIQLEKLFENYQLLKS
ncbi:type A von willebrand factor domain protein (macronuclear) [Tetrahymena thermophila SB210]|uniref:Type A von willebrand factor domain protein n=1 Tax=Tetrahymena thermophila (strain SB210) TaxID=312017 RepID=Q22HH7_TETTS|nr:type A von willebrand factor domain protein [Tetrahymena thermophila SB210]EAR84724.2 type A von willebrand factor domain protein [Tetrahymena thermophila SB210]|eukprot:XP_001032387.2 type A von willebrand factor domain protein [Tetrahymena thermophila SB210]